MTHVSPATIYKLDKARHGGGKLGHKLQRIGGRRAQLAALEESEMAQMLTTKTQVNSDGRYKQIYARLTDADHARFQRLKGNKTTNDFISSLLNAHEGTTVASMTNEAANMLRNVQAKMGNVTQLDAMRRLTEVFDHAPARGTELRKAHEDVDRLTRDVARLTTDLLTTQQERDGASARAAQLTQERDFLQAELIAAQKPVPKTSEKVIALPKNIFDGDEASNILFDFVESCAGTTVKATAEGELVVTIPDKGAVSIIPLWARAVKVLGIGKKVA